MRQRVLLGVLLLASSLMIRCIASASAGPVELARWVQFPAIELQLGELEPDKPTKPRRLEPYAGWRQWCESPIPQPCRADADCGPTPDGGEQRCVVPYWASTKVPVDEREHVCAAPFPRRSQQHRRAQRLAEVIAHVCKGSCNATDLTAFVSTVAARESTWRPWKAHRLNGDQKANRLAWERLEARYAGSRHYAQQWRWHGYGLFGQNSPLYVYLWDPKAPPEVLCRDIEATDTYLARARIVARKQHDLGVAPTWATVHAALATGNTRPPASAVERFRRQAKRQGLDADRRVTDDDFGRPLGTDVLSRRLAAELLRLRLDRRGLDGRGLVRGT
jgi:hypothetical protein